MMVLLLAVQFSRAATTEVRSYAIGLGGFAEAQRESGDFEASYENTEWLGAIVNKAPFESRFFDGVSSMRDCSGCLGRLLGREDFEGGAVYDLENGRLVVKASEMVHLEVESLFLDSEATALRTAVTVYVVPGVVAGNRAMIWDGPPEGAKLVTMLSCVHLPGQNYKARTGDGVLSIEGESQIDASDDYIDGRITLLAELPSGDVDFMTGFTWLSGAEMVLELGSLDGEESVVAVVKQETISMDGSLKDEWILKEEGGAFLFERRMASLRRKDEDGEVGLEDGVRRFYVPQTFEAFLTNSGVGADSDEPDPFAPEGEKRASPREMVLYEGGHPALEELGELSDISQILEENGFEFGDGEFAVFRKQESAIYVKLSELNLELLRAILVVPSDTTAMVRIDFMEILSEGEGGEYWKKEGAKISRKIGQLMLPGQTARLKLGGKLAVELAAQIDANDELIELRASLTEDGGDFEKASLTTGMVLEGGKRVLVQESQIGEIRKAWVIEASVVIVEEVLAR